MSDSQVIRPSVVVSLSFTRFHDAEELPLGDVEGDVLHRGDGAVGDGDVRERQERLVVCRTQGVPLLPRQDPLDGVPVGLHDVQEGHAPLELVPRQVVGGAERQQLRPGLLVDGLHDLRNDELLVKNII